MSVQFKEAFRFISFIEQITFMIWNLVLGQKQIFQQKPKHQQFSNVSLFHLHGICVCSPVRRRFLL